jgi:hypothetical protein
MFKIYFAFAVAFAVVTLQGADGMYQVESLKAAEDGK